MVKLTILFPRSNDEAGFELRYNQNLALMEQMPGVRRRQACVVLGNPSGKSRYARILELYFDDFNQLDQAMLSPQGRTAGVDLMGFARDAEVIFSEVFEE